MTEIDNSFPDEWLALLGIGMYALISFEVTQPTCEGGPTVDLRLRHPMGFGVHLQCHDCRQIEMIAGPDPHPEFAGLCVRDLSNDQLESINYRVYTDEGEHSGIRLLARTLQIERFDES